MDFHCILNHQGVPGNEEADKLAEAAVREDSLQSIECSTTHEKAWWQHSDMQLARW